MLNESRKFIANVMGDDSLQKEGGDALWKSLHYALQPGMMKYVGIFSRLFNLLSLSSVFVEWLALDSLPSQSVHSACFSVLFKQQAAKCWHLLSRGKLEGRVWYWDISFVWRNSVICWTIL